MICQKWLLVPTWYQVVTNPVAPCQPCCQPCYQPCFQVGVLLLSQYCALALYQLVPTGTDGTRPSNKKEMVPATTWYQVVIFCYQMLPSVTNWCMDFSNSAGHSANPTTSFAGFAGFAGLAGFAGVTKRGSQDLKKNVGGCKVFPEKTHQEKKKKMFKFIHRQSPCPLPHDMLTQALRKSVCWLGEALRLLQSLL